MYPIYIIDQIRIPIVKNRLKLLFPFFKERQKELETYNIYSERFLRGLATRRTGKHNKEALHETWDEFVNQRYLLWLFVSSHKPKKSNDTNRSISDSTT